MPVKTAYAELARSLMPDTATFGKVFYNSGILACTFRHTRARAYRFPLLFTSCESTTPTLSTLA